MNWAIAAHISPKNGCIHNSKFPSAGNVHGNKNYTFPQCKYCLHIADFHQPSATLSQFLGQLERVGATEALMPVLVADKADQPI